MLLRQAVIRVRRRIGHRGAFLLCMGMYDLFYGWYLAARGAVEHLPLISEQAWGWLWVATGIILIGGAFTRFDASAFAIGILIKTIWALEFFRLEYQVHVPGDWLRGCYWLAFAAVTAVAATWPEPVEVLVPPPPLPLEDLSAEQIVQQARDA